MGQLRQTFTATDPRVQILAEGWCWNLAIPPVSAIFQLPPHRSVYHWRSFIWLKTKGECTHSIRSEVAGKGEVCTLLFSGRCTSLTNATLTQQSPAYTKALRTRETPHEKSTSSVAIQRQPDPQATDVFLLRRDTMVAPRPEPVTYERRWRLGRNFDEVARDRVVEDIWRTMGRNAWFVLFDAPMKSDRSGAAYTDAVGWMNSDAHTMLWFGTVRSTDDPHRRVDIHRRHKDYHHVHSGDLGPCGSSESTTCPHVWPSKPWVTSTSSKVRPDVLQTSDTRCRDSAATHRNCLCKLMSAVSCLFTDRTCTCNGSCTCQFLFFRYRLPRQLPQSDDSFNFLPVLYQVFVNWSSFIYNMSLVFMLYLQTVQHHPMLLFFSIFAVLHPLILQR